MVLLGAGLFVSLFTFVIQVFFPFWVKLGSIIYKDVEIEDFVNLRIRAG